MILRRIDFQHVRKNEEKPIKGLFVLEVEDNFGNKTKISKPL